MRLQLPTWRSKGSLALLLLLCFVLVAPAWGQVVLDSREDLDFDRPEAWALKYYSAVTQPTGFGTPPPSRPGSLDLGVEAGWVPSLSEEERRIGFYGTKVEDLNKTPVFGRLRLTVWLPADFALTLGYVPPVEVGGATPNLASLNLSRPLWKGQSFELDAQIYALGGTIEADVTCPAEEARAGDDPIRNPFGCEAASKDEVSLLNAGLELGLSYRRDAKARFEPYAALAVNRVDAEFQINARYRGLIDHTLQTTEGTTYSVTVGARWRVSERTGLAVEGFFAPLDLVRRPGARREQQDLLNARLLLTRRLRG